MHLKNIKKSYSLTDGDVDLLGRVGYAMVVTGVWQKIVRRAETAFDFFEIFDPDQKAAFRIGRISNGVYVLFTLSTGVRKYGASLAEVLTEIAYVPPRDR